MFQVCNECQEIIETEYCCGCGKENGPITEREDAYAEWFSLVKEGSSLHDARRQACLERGPDAFAEFNDDEDELQERIDVALEIYNNL